MTFLDLLVKLAAVVGIITIAVFLARVDAELKDLEGMYSLTRSGLDVADPALEVFDTVFSGAYDSGRGYVHIYVGSGSVY